ncbi:anti-sigma factor antagonist [Pontibacter diazotrophicus]|uniref:Anti-sigma factor antagonist n=1 Tax=Pontibacter diazotrophicus TaxID=1400979 RepID=A0A3D8LHK4_9BACT|nr:STAS domain-containing protein [Pontibacter diazotrophicus]RDV16828.1 anti-sigma factor antagonist [Pontibacter diazotrophicus]
MKKKTEEYSAQDFLVKVEQLDKVAVIRLAGELDANTAVAADDALSKAVMAAFEYLLIDCQDLRYISSAGVGVLLSSLHACTEKKIQIIFCGLQPKIKNVFAILGLENIITQTATREEALQYAASSAKPPLK